MPTPTAEDTFIWQLNPNTSYGGVTSITVDQNDGGAPTRGLIKFSNLNLGANEQLESATLRINSINPTPGTVSVYRMIDSWTDTSTWSQLNNGNPARENVASFTIPSPPGSGVLEINVTSDVEGWLADSSTNQGWIFISDSTDGWDFNSAESNNPPELVLQTSTNLPETETVIINANFNSGNDGFTYRDDPFFVRYMTCVRRRYVLLNIC